MQRITLACTNFALSSGSTQAPFSLSFASNARLNGSRVSSVKIVTKYQHNGVFPVAMTWLPDGSGRYLVADRNAKVWIGDPAEASTLQLYMDLPDCFVKDEVRHRRFVLSHLSCFM